MSHEDSTTLASALANLKHGEDFLHMGVNYQSKMEPMNNSSVMAVNSSCIEEKSIGVSKANSSSKAASILEGSHAQLKERLEMATSIMRKLYVSKVQLEKEIAVLKVNCTTGGAADMLVLESSMTSAQRSISQRGNEQQGVYTAVNF